MVTVQTQFIFQNCIEPEGTFSQTGSHIVCFKLAFLKVKEPTLVCIMVSISTLYGQLHLACIYCKKNFIFQLLQILFQVLGCEYL